MRQIASPGAEDTDRLEYLGETDLWISALTPHTVPGELQSLPSRGKEMRNISVKFRVFALLRLGRGGTTSPARIPLTGVAVKEI